MSDQIHEKATEIIGKIIEMDANAAMKFIDKACEDNHELKATVLELYESIKEDDTDKGIVDEGRVSSRGFSKSRIGPGQEHKTKVLGNVTQLLFGNKRGRLISLILFLLVMFALGFFALVVLVFAIVQIPALLAMIPAIAIVFSMSETTPAIIFSIYAIIVSLSDNVLKPMLLGKGLETPMLVILIGALGGMIFMGMLGLFIGPVVLSIVYQLYIRWVNETKINGEDTFS